MTTYLILYIVLLHVLWATYAATRSASLNIASTIWDVLGTFVLNLLIAPVSIILGTYTESQGKPSIRDIFK